MKKEKQSGLVPRLRFAEFEDAGAWSIGALGDIATFASGGTPSKDVSEYWNGHIPWISAASMYDTNIRDSERKVTASAIGNGTRIAKAGTLLILTRGSMLYNRVPMGIASIDVAFNQDVRALTIDSAVDASFLMKQLIAQESRIPINDTGIGAGKIDTDDLRRLEVTIPSPAEQQKIADCLGSLDDLIAAEGRKLGALRQHKQGLMQGLFPRPGETVPRLRFPEVANAPEWDERTIGGVCDLKAGDFISASEIAEHSDEGLFPCYGGNGFRGYVKSFTHEGRYVLVGRQGALCGNVNLFTGKFHATEHALVATPKPGIDTSWLFYALDVLKLNRFSIGQAQPGLSVGVLSDVSISVPIKEDEQKEIADSLSSLDALIAVQTDEVAALHTHKKGLLQQLFPSLEGR